MALCTKCVVCTTVYQSMCQYQVDYGRGNTVIWWGEALEAGNMESQKKYLETSFWTENSENEQSDDEGIGSDESMEKTEPCLCDMNSDKTQSWQSYRSVKSKSLNNETKDPLRVTKFLRILKQSMIPLKLRNCVFGVDLSTHIATAKTAVPMVVTWCTRTVEGRGKKDIKNLEGVYRLSGQVSHIKALKLCFDASRLPTKHDAINTHSIGSLLKVGV